MKLPYVVLIAALMATPAIAQEDTLTGPEIRALLPTVTIEGSNGATQTFFADGRTVYTYASGAESRGRWEVSGGYYVSTWPSSSSPAFYQVTRNGNRLTFVAVRGGQTAAYTIVGGAGGGGGGGGGAGDGAEERVYYIYYQETPIEGGGYRIDWSYSRGNTNASRFFSSGPYTASEAADRVSYNQENFNYRP